MNQSNISSVFVTVNNMATSKRGGHVWLMDKPYSVDIRVPTDTTRQKRSCTTPTNITQIQCRSTSIRHRYTGTGQWQHPVTILPNFTLTPCLELLYQFPAAGNGTRLLSHTPAAARLTGNPSVFYLPDYLTSAYLTSKTPCLAMNERARKR